MSPVITGAAYVAVFGILAGPALGQTPRSADLDTRVTLEHRSAPAETVVKWLAKAAGLELEGKADDLPPMTITLRNVRVRTALDVVCDGAGCTWDVVDGRTLRVLKVPRSSSLDLPGTISINMRDRSVGDILEAVTSALRVSLKVEGRLEEARKSMELVDAPTEFVLTSLCGPPSCVWRFEPDNQRLVVSAK